MGKLTDNGYSKYSRQEKKYSIDGGVTFKSYDPPQYRMGKLVQIYSPDCGYVPTADSYTKILYFNGELLDNIVFPTGTMDGTYTNGNGNISKVRVGDTVDTIGDAAFANCSVIEVKLPEGLTYIGDDAFSGCKDLNNIYYLGTVEQFSHVTIGENAFKGVVSLIGCDCIHCSDGDAPLPITS